MLNLVERVEARGAVDRVPVLVDGEDDGVRRGDRLAAEDLGSLDAIEIADALRAEAPGEVLQLLIEGRTGNRGHRLKVLLVVARRPDHVSHQRRQDRRHAPDLFQRQKSEELLSERQAARE